MDYGYARVSTREQNELRQLVALEQFGLPESQIFVDKQSGKDFNRRSYKRLVRRLAGAGLFQARHTVYYPASLIVWLCRK